jgi:hypothetical protein
MDQGMTARKRIVIGLGGNAVLRRGEIADASVQLHHIVHAAPGLAKVASELELVLVHGNGPQVGMLARESEDDSTLTATYPLDALVAETQGLLGYWLQQSITNAGLGRPITTIVTQTVVDPDDPAFAAPTKFIGRGYDQTEARRLATKHSWQIAADGPTTRRFWSSGSTPNSSPAEMPTLGPTRLRACGETATTTSTHSNNTSIATAPASSRSSCTCRATSKSDGSSIDSTTRPRQELEVLTECR